jgi:hypothetical protein
MFNLWVEWVRRKVATLVAQSVGVRRIVLILFGALGGLAVLTTNIETVASASEKVTQYFWPSKPQPVLLDFSGKGSVPYPTGGEAPQKLNVV